MPDIDRSCGACGMCCKLPAIPELNKPANQWCVHAVRGKGCAIYGSHPDVCKAWKCGWQVSPQLDASWRPDRCGFILRNEFGERHFIIDVDPAKPGAWRREPYYGWIKRRARSSDLRRQQVIVHIGPRAIALFPDDEIDVGRLDPDEFPALAVRYRGDLGQALVEIRSRTTAEVVRIVEGPWRPKAAFAGVSAAPSGS